jgi:hypothetical protein
MSSSLNSGNGPEKKLLPPGTNKIKIKKKKDTKFF